MKRFLAALLFGLAGIVQAAITTVPPHPTAGRTFVIKTEGNGCGLFLNQRAEVVGKVITLVYEDEGVCFSPPFPGHMDLSVPVKVPAPGSYEVRHRATFRGDVGEASTGLFVTVTGNDFTGLWFDPAAPGWGLHVAQGESGTLFATWFTYSATLGSNFNRTAGAWYFASSMQTLSATEARGGVFLARSANNVTPVGTLALRIPVDGQLEMQVTGTLFDGATKSLRRLEF